MEILYLYFLQSKSIKIGGQDINFGGKYRFSYNEKFKKLTATPNPFFIEDFFSLNKENEAVAKMLNVTSIIGENGTGKTSLLKLIKTNFVDGYARIINPLIVAFSNDQKTVVYYCEEFTINEHNLADLNIQIEMIKGDKRNIISNQNDFYYSTPPKLDEFSNTDFISFSNIFDGNNEIEIKGGYEISTNYLIRNDFIKNFENQYINHEINQRQIDIHLFEEIERQIAFVNRYAHEPFIPFELPEYIYLTTKKEVDYEFGYSRIEKDILEEFGLMNDFLSLTVLLKKSIGVKDGNEKLIDYFISSCLLNFFIELATNYRSIRQHAGFKINLSVVKDLSLISDIAIGLIEDIKEQSKELFSGMPEDYYRWVEGAIGFIKKLPYFVTKNEQGEADLNMLVLKVTESSREDFKNFYNSYRNSYRLKPFINFKWHSLSSGENALFNIYSRFYSLSNNETINELKESVIILIDEGDIYLHPAWQKKFIFLLLDYLPRVYSKTRSLATRKIQIIFTTNLPIPASDLPNGNTIFLEKNTSHAEERLGYVTKTIVKDSLNDQKETFAANIFTLYSDSFFIKDGLIGEFALIKINEIINQLTKGTKPDAKRRLEIRNVIHQIGEPILKHKLMQLYNDRFNLEIHERLDLIESKLGM